MHLKLETELGGIVAGVDEAGRGPLAGPVYAAAVILRVKCIPEGINDSKQLTRAQREAVYDCIIESAAYGIGCASVEEIDQINILQATKLAMQRAVAALPYLPDTVLVDGNQAPTLPCPVRTIIGGDAQCLSIAAASILAKVTRDRLMCQLANEFPEYGFERHVGYSTREHMDALIRLGPTPHHRRSFAPVRQAMMVLSEAA